MKLLDRGQNFVMDGIQGQRFEIEASAKAFDIISSKLYSQPILAIVRELSTNAIDAHIEAGNEHKKYDVSLPTELTPYFVIRDYGTGLTPEQVDTVFRVVFKSTKTKSNEVTGCLGLGSKSPLAYADSFNVESFVDGTQYNFSVYKDGEGIPTVLPVGEKETDEPNGLRISLGVFSQDCNKFVQAARKVYPYLSIKPNFLTGSITLEDVKYSEQGAYWGICEGSRPNGYTGLMVTMGGVAYPVAQKIDTAEFSDIERAFININIDLNLNIGDVDIEAGREGLQFTKRTQNVIKHKFKGIVSYFTDKVKNDFSQCKTKWEAYCFATDYKHALGRIITEHIFKNISTTIDGEVVKPVQREIAYYDGLNHIVERSGLYRKKSCDTIRPSKNSVIIWDDDCKAAYARARYYASQNLGKKIYYVKSADPLGREKLVEACGMRSTDIINTTDLPKKPSTKTAAGKSNGPKKKTAAAVMYNNTLNAASAWKDAVIDIYQPHYYVPIDRYYPVFNTTNLNISVIREAIKCLEILGIPFNEPVYGLRRNLAEKVKKDPNSKCINLIDLVLEKLAAYDVKENFIQKFLDVDAARHIINGSLNGVYKVISAQWPLIKDNNSPMRKIGEVVASLDKLTYDKYKVLYRFLRTIPGSCRKNPSLDLTKLEQAAILKYPFLAVARYCDDSIMTDHLIQYINAIDKF